MQFGDMTYEEIAQAAAAGAIAVVPTGCTEQQGPHLPVDSHTWFVSNLMHAAAARVEPEIRVVVLPALPFGPTPEHRNFGAGYIDIPAGVYNSLVGAVLDSLADQGFGRILVWRGCGGHDLQGVVAAFNAERAGRSRAFLPGHPFHEVWCALADPGVPGGHADSFMTSVLLARRPDAVRRDRVPSGCSLAPGWEDPNLDFARYSSTGVIGSAEAASAELGAKLWEASVDAVANSIIQIAAGQQPVIEPTMNQGSHDAGH